MHTSLGVLRVTEELEIANELCLPAEFQKHIFC